MRALIRRRDRIRRAAAWLALVSIAALLVLPALAFAADNLVTSKSLPDDWNVIFDDPELFSRSRLLLTAGVGGHRVRADGASTVERRSARRARP